MHINEGRKVTGEIKSRLYFICLIGQNDKWATSIKRKKLCDAYVSCTASPPLFTTPGIVDGLQGGQEGTQT